MRRFQRTIEDFICERCGMNVDDRGYRNHCPECLISKHVDIFPGDRLAECQGLMDVADIAMEHGDLIIVHECIVCHHRKPNRIAPDDDIAILLAFMRERAMGKNDTLDRMA